MTMGLFLQILALGVLEPGLDQNFLYAGLKKTPASVSSCMVGVCPALTFIGSWIFGLETVRVNQRRSQAKILGTIIMAGAGILIGLYNGPTVVVSSSSHSELAGDAIEGSLYVSIAVLAYVSYNILMGKVVMQYPAPLALTAFICLIGAVIDTGVALTLEIRRGVSWSIGWNIELLSYFYSGLIVSALSSYIQSMLIKSKGPVFVTSFNPVSMILVILLALVTVGENLYLGRVIGVILLMGGLFTLLWGKSGEEHI